MLLPPVMTRPAAGKAWTVMGATEAAEGEALRVKVSTALVVGPPCTVIVLGPSLLMLPVENKGQSINTESTKCSHVPGVAMPIETGVGCAPTKLGSVVVHEAAKLMG